MIAQAEEAVKGWLLTGALKELDLFDLAFDLRRQVLFLLQIREQSWRARADVLQQRGLEFLHPVQRNVIEIALGAGVNDHYFLLHWHWAVLRLFEKLDEASPAIELRLRGLVQFGTQLCEGFELAWMRPPLPDFDVPGNGRDTVEHLRERTYVGARERWGDTLSHDQRAQLEKEIEMIGRLGFAGFFLVMWDAVRFARARGILCQGRGSAANSAVAFCLGITAVDPVKNGLLFERFISEVRWVGRPRRPISTRLRHTDAKRCSLHVRTYVAPPRRSPPYADVRARAVQKRWGVVYPTELAFTFQSASSRRARRGIRADPETLA